MLLDAIKTAVKTYIPVAGNKIKRVDHVNANDTMISALYYSDWGIPKPYFAYTLPEGYVWCDGSTPTVPISDCHPEFIAIMGSMYPIYGGIPGETIGIPYIPNGSSLIQSGGSFELGAIGGEVGVTLNNTEMPIHNHPNGVADDGTTLFVYGGTTTGMPGSATASIQQENNARIYQGFTGNSGGLVGTTLPHNNMPPYFVVNYILRIR